MYENSCDLVIIDSEEFEKKKIRYALEDKLEEMMGGASTHIYIVFDEYISAFCDEMEIMREETDLLGAADRERMLR